MLREQRSTYLSRSALLRGGRPRPHTLRGYGADDLLGFRRRVRGAHVRLEFEGSRGLFREQRVAFFRWDCVEFGSHTVNASFDCESSETERRTLLSAARCASLVALFA